jgi:hypothetical protein
MPGGKNGKNKDRENGVRIEHHRAPPPAGLLADGVIR